MDIGRNTSQSRASAGATAPAGPAGPSHRLILHLNMHKPRATTELAPPHRQSRLQGLPLRPSHTGQPPLSLRLPTTPSGQGDAAPGGQQLVGAGQSHMGQAGRGDRGWGGAFLFIPFPLALLVHLRRAHCSLSIQVHSSFSLHNC